MAEIHTAEVKPRVFIGSSTAGLDVAREIQNQLHKTATVTVWDQEDWLGKSTLNQLMKILSEYDFAVLILRPDDVADIKGERKMAARDNVLFELGLFMGKHGREKTFIVFQEDDNMRVPSDLLGINFALYQAGSTGDIAVACNRIRERILRIWEEEQKTALAAKDINPLTLEAGMLYRILNAASSPQYKAIDSDLLGPIEAVGEKSFADIEHVIEIAGELFSHYMFPHLKSAHADLRRMRVYFAYYLGDGAPIEVGVDPLYCIGKDDNGKEFKGTFVIGISNSDKFPERNWMSGLPLQGYAGGHTGKSLSNAAEVFRKAEAHLISDTDHLPLHAGHLNFNVENEKTVYSVPVLLSDKRWNLRESLAPIGILTISGSHPGMITPEIRKRADHLAILLGFIFYLHATQNPDEPAVGKDIGISVIPIGFEGASDPKFVRRAVSLRREVAKHFEEYFIQQEIHELRGQELTYR
jgi:hypothetical protein